MSVFSQPILFRTVGLLLSLAALGARAETVPDLYRAAVPVSEQSPAELKRAAPLGLADVLVRVSGRSEAATAPALREPIADAERYVEQYRYERAADGALQLSLQFSPASIKNLLGAAGLLGGKNPAANNREGLQLRVAGVENFADYASLLGYLNGMLGGAGSSKVSPQTIEGNVVTLALSADNGAEHLIQQWAIDRRLLPEAADATASAATLRYRWQGRGG